MSSTRMDDDGKQEHEKSISVMAHNHQRQQALRKRQLDPGALAQRPLRQLAPEEEVGGYGEQPEEHRRGSAPHPRSQRPRNSISRQSRRRAGRGAGAATPWSTRSRVAARATVAIHDRHLLGTNLVGFTP